MAQIYVENAFEFVLTKKKIVRKVEFHEVLGETR